MPVALAGRWRHPDFYKVAFDDDPGFFERSELTRALWFFRREFVVVGVFSMVANVLMLSPTLYMLQVFDRVDEQSQRIDAAGDVTDHPVFCLA